MQKCSPAYPTFSHIKSSGCQWFSNGQPLFTLHFSASFNEFVTIILYSLQFQHYFKLICHNKSLFITTLILFCSDFVIVLSYSLQMQCNFYLVWDTTIRYNCYALFYLLGVILL